MPRRVPDCTYNPDTKKLYHDVCNQVIKHEMEYDNYYCPTCNIWLEKFDDCGDTTCQFHYSEGVLKVRPDKPFDK